jgi:hypothetical protein
MIAAFPAAFQSHARRGMTLRRKTREAFRTARRVFSYCGIHVAPRNRCGIPALFERHRHGRLAYPKSYREALQPSRGANIFYRVFGTVKNEPSTISNQGGTGRR